MDENTVSQYGEATLRTRLIAAVDARMAEMDADEVADLLDSMESRHSVVVEVAGNVDALSTDEVERLVGMLLRLGFTDAEIGGSSGHVGLELNGRGMSVIHAGQGLIRRASEIA